MPPHRLRIAPGTEPVLRDIDAQVIDVDALKRLICAFSPEPPALRISPGTNPLSDQPHFSFDELDVPLDGWVVLR